MKLSSSKDKVVTGDERGGSKKTNRKRGSSDLADFVFQIKARATSSNKGISDRMRKWNVYSKGADKSAHMRRSNALVQTVTFCYGCGVGHSKKQVSLQGSEKWQLVCPPPPRLIYPICVSTHPLQFQFHTTPQISNLFCLCNAIEILSHSMPMTLSHRQKIEITFAIEIFHVYTDLTGAT